MKEVFVSPDFHVPEKLETTNFHFHPLTPKYLDMDYAAIISSLEHLRKSPTPPICGDWPQPTITKEDDLKDLIWHEKMHLAKEVFAYTVLTPDESKCIGCVYFFPSENLDNDATIYFWMTKKESDQGLDQKLFDTIKIWLKESWPFQKVAFPGRE